MNYLNNKIIRKIKTYNINGNLSLEGKYISHKLFNGITKIYNDDCGLFLEEEFGKENIKGKVMIYNDNNKIEF